MCQKDVCCHKTVSENHHRNEVKTTYRAQEVYRNAFIETGKQASRCTGQVIKKSHFYTKHIRRRY